VQRRRSTVWLLTPCDLEPQSFKHMINTLWWGIAYHAKREVISIVDFHLIVLIYRHAKALQYIPAYVGFVQCCEVRRYRSMTWAQVTQSTHLIPMFIHLHHFTKCTFLAWQYEVRWTTKQSYLSTIVQACFSLFVHTARMPDETDAKIVKASPLEALVLLVVHATKEEEYVHKINEGQAVGISCPILVHF